MGNFLSTARSRGRKALALPRRGWWVCGLGLWVCGFWCLAATAQMLQRPSTVWGDVPPEQQGLVVGGVEVLTTMLVVLVVSGALAGLVLMRALRLLQRARRAEGTELEFVWSRTQLTQKWASWIAFGLLPLAVISTLLLAPYRTLFGFGISELALSLFLVGSLVGGTTFLVLEAIRRTLGAQRS